MRAGEEQMSTLATGNSSQKAGVETGSDEAGGVGMNVGLLKLSFHRTSPWKSAGDVDMKEVIRAVGLAMTMVRRAIANKVASSRVSTKGKKAVSWGKKKKKLKGVDG